MKSKQALREQLEAGMAIFLSQGKQITKVETQKKRNSQPKEEVIEIEVQYLPKALQDKYFPES